MVLKTKALFFSTLYTITLTFVSLITLDLDDVEEIIPSYSDKIFHLLAYLLFAWLWFNTFFYRYKYNKNQSIIRSIIVSSLFGIIIEVLQLVITTSRNFDVLDIVANIFGVLIAAILINNYIKIEVKKY
ncbi:VanZ like protein [Xanthomarina spongicola]|uniref:VanZ like protein n=1 Tax=Xanthomarina spongicola TaxID=570520 RepID=A0A316DUM7_9FLAO|nr:VanZ like protein [Xanthomarina spongicola]